MAKSRKKALKEKKNAQLEKNFLKYAVIITVVLVAIILFYNMRNI